MNNSNTEIDLIALLIKTTKFIKQYFILFVIFLFIGVVFGVIAFVVIPKNYYSEMLATTGLESEYYTETNEKMTKKEVELIATTLNNLNNFDDFKKQGLVNNVKIGKIEALLVEEDKNITEIKISIDLNSKSDIKFLTSFLNEYLEKNEYINNKLEMQKTKNSKLIKKFDLEISELDSLQKLHLKRNFADNQIVYDNSSAMNHQILLKLYEKKLILQNKNTKPLIVITDFFPAKEKENNKIFIILVFAFIFLSIGIAVAMIKELLKLSK